MNIIIRNKMEEALSPEEFIAWEALVQWADLGDIYDDKGCCEVLAGSFVWKDTPQGYAYWNSIWERLEF